MWVGDHCVSVTAKHPTVCFLSVSLAAAPARGLVCPPLSAVVDDTRANSFLVNLRLSGHP